MRRSRKERAAFSTESPISSSDTPKLLTFVLLLPPLLWIGVVYVGSLFALLLQSFYSLDDYSGLIIHEFTLSTYKQLLETANLQIIIRTVMMSALVTLACAVIAFPIAYYAARYARGWTKALFYLAVMMPLWSSYLVKIYAWKLILAKEGIITWLANGVHLSWPARSALRAPRAGRTRSRSSSPATGSSGAGGRSGTTAGARR